MRFTFLLVVVSFCSASLGLAAETDETPLAVAQQLLNAMKAHDGAAASSLFIPGAALASIQAGGKVSLMPAPEFVQHLNASKSIWLERIWNAKVLEEGPIAVVWAEYDFHANGQFSHCGIDSFSLLKTAAGWKIAGVSDTRKTAGCKPSPLGPPPMAH